VKKKELQNLNKKQRKTIVYVLFIYDSSLCNYLKKNNKNSRVPQVIKYLPSKHEALSSNHRTAGKKKILDLSYQIESM
jgi:hypothetical protein